MAHYDFNMPIGEADARRLELNDTVTLNGNVVVTRGKDVVRGQRMIVDLNTGVSRIESDTGRVQVLVIQGQGCASPIPGAPPPDPRSAAPVANKPK